jgi:hypothetical protein
MSRSGCFPEEGRREVRLAAVEERKLVGDYPRTGEKAS